MKTIRQLQDDIIKLRDENDICILAHAYQSRDITEVASFVGDSYGLAVQASKTDAKTVVMCGVRFMAETVKILCPDKRVILSHPDAGCPMAEQLSREELQILKMKNPDHTVVAYINTTAELKTECDVCVTSSSAVEIVDKIENDKILFVPDCNLGAYVQSKCPSKKLKLFNGGCPTHARISLREAKAAKAAHPDALLLVHPECTEKITAQADFIGSTTGIMAFAKKSDANEFIIGTENSIVQHLQFECPDKRFYPLSKDCCCHNMKLTTLNDVYNCITGKAGEEIILDEETRLKAKACLDKMIELGG